MRMLFSVIIPLYNKAPYTAKAVKSVLLQTFTDFELIVVDDGSGDGSAEIALAAMEGRANSRLIRQKNAGVSVARNHGVAVSRGTYVCFLDADDWWEPTFLEEMAKLIAAYPEAGIYGVNYTIVNQTKRKTRVANVGVDEGFVSGYINYCQVYAKTMYMPMTSISVAIPRLVFDQAKGFPGGIKLGEDFLLWLRIALNHKVAFLNHPLACYNQDVNQSDRSVGKLYPPENHMLWNLMDFEPFEKTNQDYKQLIDNLRTYGLLPYYVSKTYHDTAKRELAKVDWARQPQKVRKRYEMPLAFLKCWYWIVEQGSKMKQLVRRVGK